MILDNNDSFTWNLVETIRQTTTIRIEVRSSIAVDIESISAYDGLLISPGPGLPDDYPKLRHIILENVNTLPILGICLGHQAIATAFGGCLKNLENIWHGKEALVKVLDKRGCFAGLPDEIPAGLYHSWAVDEQSLPRELTVTARDQRGEVMGIRHLSASVEGLQFHPESYLTPLGKQMLSNWIQSIVVNLK